MKSSEENNSSTKVNLDLYKTFKSLCKIVTKDKVIGTGFFMKINRNKSYIYFLLTTQHIITEKMIESQEEISIEYNNNKNLFVIKLDKSERIINSFNDLDIIVIEIKQNDDIKEKYFLSKYEDNKLDLINKDIYLLQYLKGNDLSYSEGIIKEINEYNIVHNCTTEQGSSGSPILLKNNLTVIGMHKGFNHKLKLNLGTLIYPLIQLLENYILNNEEKIIYENGIYYIGQFENNRPNGKGKLYYNNGNILYEGDFINGKREGFGKYIDKNGDVYEGQWLNGKKHGEGKIFYKNGDLLYEGDFVKGKKEGKGKYIYKNFNYYIGQWLNDLPDGTGTIYYKNGDILYEGEFVKGKYEGLGKFIHKNGNYYIGDFVNDKRHGKGKEYKKDGHFR